MWHGGPVRPEDLPQLSKPITHARAGKAIGVPGELLEYAARYGLVDSLGHRGQWYLFAEDALPERKALIAAVRERYRDLLRQVDDAANAVLAEIEAVQDDARDMLEHYTDPVGEFGDDLAMVTELRQDSTLHRHMDRLRGITFDARMAHHCLHLLDAPAEVAAVSVPGPLPVRARRADRQRPTQ